MQRSSVLLPEPERPMRQIVSRGYTSSVDAAEDVVGAEVLLDRERAHDRRRAGRGQRPGSSERVPDICIRIGGSCRHRPSP